MKVIRATEFGSADVLRLEEDQELRPGFGEMIVAVEAVGVGFVDLMARKGNYAPLAEPGFVPGIEVAGHVTDIGGGVPSDWRERRVFALLKSGGYAEQVRVDQSSVVPLPAGVGAADAVALGVNALVARFALDRARMAPGASVLVRGASGGIGALATQLAASDGGRVTAVTSSAERSARLLELGAAAAVDRKTAQQDEVSRFDIVVDTVAGDDVPAFVRKLAQNGCYVLCGGAGGPSSTGFADVMMERFHDSPTFVCFSLNSVAAADWRSVASDLFKRADDSAIKPLVGPVFALADAADAHRQMEAGGIFGKVVLVP